MEAKTNTILIIEDDEHLIELLAEKVEACGYQTICLQSAESALDWLHDHAPLLMVLDYSLPDMNGKEFIAELKETGNALPPFIVSTGQGDERIAVEMMKLGARDYIIKDNQFHDMFPLVITKVSNEVKNEILLKQTESALVELGQFNKQIIQSAHEGVIVYDHELKFELWNPYMEILTGIPEGDVLKNYAVDVFPFLKEVGLIPNVEKALLGEFVSEMEYQFDIPATGKSGWVSETIGPLINSVGEITGVIGTVRDITERKQTERYREMGTEILQILNEQIPLQDSIQRILASFKTHSGIDSVGIRLQEGDDFPYIGQQGFSEEFLRTENSLLERDANGFVCRDEFGNVRLECTCGLVLSAQSMPSNALFTPGGSFWTNDSFPLLELSPELDPRFHPRNQCMHHGYASMALVPIRTKNGIIGLIHFDDRRNNCFSLVIIEQLESIAAHIGEALMRKQAEEALELSEKKYRDTTEQLPLCIFETNLQGNFTFANKTAFETFGYTNINLKNGINILKTIAPEFVELATKNFQNVMNGAISSPHEYLCLKKDGSTFPVLVQTNPIIENKKTIGIRGFIIDITDRKQSEKILLESKENLAEAQRIAKIGSWELDIISNKLIWSQEMYTVFDICPVTSITETESLLKAVHTEDVEIFNNFMNSSLLDTHAISCEYRVIHKDNSIHHIFAESRIKFDEAGNPVKRNGTAQDITERKIAEAERNSLEQMHMLAQYTEKAREDERTNISRELHDDLGQSLTAIKIDLGLIKKLVSDSEAVARITKLSGLVGETIKTVQRLTSQLRPQMLDDLGLELTLDWYTKEFAIRNHIEINLEIDSELELSHDASLNLFRIVQESLTNIARHAHSTQVDINISETKDTIYLRITDNGIGINEEKIKAKESFGIISMKERAALLGGILNIYNKNNAGTEIMLILPTNKKLDSK